MPAYDACPECGGRKRSKNKRCAKCYGYGTYRHVMPNGYVRVWNPDHPLAKKDGHVLEHRMVLHDAGIVIPKGAHVHHKNEDRTDNRLENLEVKSPRDHIVGHLTERGVVVNQFGEWTLHTPDSRRAMWARKAREYRARKRQEQAA